ncbi:PorT family protein [Pedobacter frigidisoli]|uniref:PorT family protein n=1 Tax=Pedobacter frigidisoli TaxID=2530455 RepID=A0A4V2MN21_9SPHI|nr:porin family protein [Pedobacter frigidisoli]TCD11110.1 PorT family protein [Pedobacter frigidisoli]
MKKTLLSLLMVAGIGYAASAQTNNAIKIGVKAGVNFPTFSVSGLETNNETFKTNTSFYVGGTVDIPVSEIFSVQPGLSLIGKGAKQEYSESGMVAGQTYSATETSKRSLMYLELPVNLIANFAVGQGKIFVGAGPYYAMAISGKDKDSSAGTINGTSSSESSESDVKFGSNSDSDMKRGDFGVNFLAGYQLNSGVNIHAGYGLGLSDISNENSSQFKATNRVFSVGVGFSF